MIRDDTMGRMMPYITSGKKLADFLADSREEYDYAEKAEMSEFWDEIVARLEGDSGTDSSLPSDRS